MPKKTPTIGNELTLEERLRLQAADLTHREGKLLYRYHKNARVLRGSIAQSVMQLKFEKTEPPELFLHLRRNAARLEKQVNNTLEIYGDQHVPVRWMRTVGVGISQAVGIYSSIDIEKSHKISSLWRYCGYDPTVKKLTKKEAGEVIKYYQEETGVKYPDELTIRKVADGLNRGPGQLLRLTRVGTKKTSITWGKLYKAILSYPWNQELKEILYRCGVMFRRTGGRGAVTSPYRAIYDWRKEYEVSRNEAGDYADQAAYKLESRNFRKTTVAYANYIQGKLPPGHLDARARRFAVKIFIVHLHQIMFFQRYRKMPDKPYVLAVLGKEKEIVCPKWPFKESS